MTIKNLSLYPKQIKSFSKALANRRFIDLSHAGTGKTAPACCLTGFVMKGQVINAGEAQTSTSIPYSKTTKATSAKNLTNGKYNGRAIWIQPSSLMEKNREELLMWNSEFKASQVKVIKGKNANKKVTLNLNLSLNISGLVQSTLSIRN